MRTVIIKDKYGVGTCFSVENEMENILNYIEDYCSTGECKTQIQIKLQDITDDQYNKYKEYQE